ncbi:MAG: hypothetical protein LBK47_09150 [Prevotellaceae bacterium]|jgi:nucleoid DNA-binding protein|nr:hypothetical protein [Prevotellaceae bacterium]
MISSYLRDLVLANHRVIIPDFGAFLKKDKAATSLENSVTFSPFLRFNDGLFEDYIVEKEHVSKEQASERIRQFIISIKEAIAQQKPYILEDFGAFYQDGRGAVQFIYGDTEREVRSRFAEIMGRIKATTAAPKVSEPEVEVHAADVEVVESELKSASKSEAEEQPEKSTKKPVEVEEVEAEEVETKDDNEEGEEMNKAITVNGKKEAEKANPAKDSNAVSTIINVNVNADKEKSKSEEAIRDSEKAKQLEAANASLQAWITEVNKRKEDKETADRKEVESKLSIAEEALLLQRRKQEELERILAEKQRKEQEELEAKKKQEEDAREIAKKKEEEARLNVARQREAALAVATAKEEKVVTVPVTPSAIWEEDDEPSSSPKGVLWLLLVLLVLLIVSGALWFWTPISEALWSAEPERAAPVQVYTLKTMPEPAPLPFIPKVSNQQRGVYYVVVGSFNEQGNAIEFSQILYRLGVESEIVVTDGGMLAVCIAKNTSQESVMPVMNAYKAKYGAVWIMY